MAKKEAFIDMPENRKFAVIKDLSAKSEGALKRKFYKYKFDMKIRIRFYERLAAFLDNGIRITDALETICSRYYLNNDFRAYIIGNILYRIQQDAVPYHEALKEWIPREEHMIIAAANSSGKDADGLREATYLTKSTQEIKKAITGELAMPVLLLIMLYLMFVGFRIKMIPIMELILPRDKWEGASALLHNVSSFLTTYWFIFLSIVVGVTLVVRWTIPNLVTPIRDKLDNLPPWSIYKIICSVSFMIGLSSLMRAGLPTTQSLRTLEKMSNPYVRHFLSRMIKNITSGDAKDNIGKAINVGLIEKELAGDMEDMAKLTSFKDTLYNSSKRYLNESIEAIKIKATTIRILMMFILVASLGWLMSSFYTTIQQIRQSVKGY